MKEWILLIALTGLISACGGRLDLSSTSAVGANKPSTVCEDKPPVPIGSPFGGGLYSGTCTQDGRYFLVITPSGCDLNTPTNPTCSGADTQTRRFDSATPRAEKTGFTSRYRGDLNSPGLSSAEKTTHQAAKYCEDLVYGGYSDWYLPASFELTQALIANAGAGGNPLGTLGVQYWSSSEFAEDPTQFASSCLDSTQYKTDKYELHHVRCLRRMPTGP